MPDDLTVGATTAVVPHPEPTPAAHRLDPPASPAHGANFPNPSMRLDPALGVVVMTFRDQQGVVTSSIPTQQQLDAYRTWERTGGGPAQADGGAGGDRR